MKKKMVGVVGCMFLASLCLTGNALAARSDEIQSRHIDEADGISGQDTNSGSGVKTGHIQDGAVTDAKIAGPISTSKLYVGTSADTVAAGDHDHNAVYQKKAVNVVVVAESGGDFSDPRAAVQSLSGVASAANPYLVMVRPGTYDLGTNSLDMVPFVTLEGSGMENTTITSTAINGDFDTCEKGTIVMADHSAIRNLMVKNTAVDAGNDGLVAGVVVNNVEATLDTVGIRVGSLAADNARNNGVCSDLAGGKANLKNVDIEVFGNAGDANAVIVSDGSTMTITDSKLVATMDESGDEGNSCTHVVDCYGFHTMEPQTVIIRDSHIESRQVGESFGANNSVLWFDSGCTMKVMHSTMVLANESGIILDGGELFTIMNSQLYSASGDVASNSSGKIANSLIQGGVNEDVTLTNNYDENLTPIANQ